MKEQEVLQLIRRGEHFRLEAKKAEKGLPASLWESYAAFCNTDGGVILLGVSENAEKQLFVSGVEDSDKLVQAFWNQINNKQKVSDNLLFNHQVYVLTVEEKRKDRLSISNPGTLRITLNEALEGGISDPRNTVIFKMFVLINIGERTGSGLQNIRYVWDRMKLPEPQLKEVFSPDRLHLEIPLSNEDYDFASTVSEPVVIYSKVPDKVPDNLTDNQRQIVNLLLGNSKMSMAELARQIGISKRKILDNINKLKEQNLLRRVGENKTGYWEVL